MKIKEISVGISGVIPIASYENLKPNFNMTVEVEEGENPKVIFKKVRAYLRDMFELEANRAKTDLIEKQYASIRFYERNGKKYPSVTSILGWDIDWKISEDKLRQYASRGTIVHKLVEIYLREGKWLEPDDIPELQEDIAIVCGGSLNLSWKDCTYKAFFEKFKDDIEVEETEQTIYNEEALYAGTLDIRGKYKGEKAIFDLKTGSTSDFRQLVAYGVTQDSVKTLVICPVGPSKNKCGYNSPKVSNALESEYKAFLRARSKFRNRFGI